MIITTLRVYEDTFSRNFKDVKVNTVIGYLLSVEMCEVMYKDIDGMTREKKCKKIIDESNEGLLILYLA